MCLKLKNETANNESSSSSGQGEPSEITMGDVTFMIKNMNYLINFFLYSLLSKLFRQELLAMISGGEKSPLSRCLRLGGSAFGGGGGGRRRGEEPSSSSFAELSFSVEAFKSLKKGQYRNSHHRGKNKLFFFKVEPANFVEYFRHVGRNDHRGHSNGRKQGGSGPRHVKAKLNGLSEMNDVTMGDGRDPSLLEFERQLCEDFNNNINNDQQINDESTVRDSEKPQQVVIVPVVVVDESSETKSVVALNPLQIDAYMDDESGNDNDQDVLVVENYDYDEVEKTCREEKQLPPLAANDDHKCQDSEPETNPPPPPPPPRPTSSTRPAFAVKKSKTCGAISNQSNHHNRHNRKNYFAILKTPKQQQQHETSNGVMGVTKKSALDMRVSIDCDRTRPVTDC